MRLDIDGVRVSLDGTPILRGADLAVGAGQLLALVGPNGSGKTTLLRTVYRALRPDAGVVSLNDDDVWRLSAREAARRRAVVTQHFTGSGEFTATEMVAMGRAPHLGVLRREGEPRLVAEALDRVGMAWAARRVFRTLSGGERQRVLLARALAQRAPLVVLDEPTNHLDAAAQLELLRLVKRLNVTVLAAMHDLDHAASHADRVTVLDKGAVVTTGPPEEVLAPELIERVFRVRAHIAPHPLTGRPHIALAPLHD
ncbi:ABC transporter ATP-binding protein [Pseudonocardia eucalypti]|uniref:ABC transporter ATP-binding protein n=1 Tax=Pseudonocardia eucalypti TaxID=648755 RepID=A0ABP9PFH1_9PSEU|nr:iron complex transport system ATP-binding protein [Pseudonocardia eucalypti]